MENMFYVILGALVTFFGLQYYIVKGAEKSDKKIKIRKSEISKMSTANLIALANSILARRDSSGK